MIDRRTNGSSGTSNELTVDALFLFLFIVLLKIKKLSEKLVCKSDTESNYNNQNMGRTNNEGFIWGREVI